MYSSRRVELRRTHLQSSTVLVYHWTSSSAFPKELLTTSNFCYAGFSQSYRSQVLQADCKHWIGTRNQAFESLIAQEISCATSYIILFVMQPCSVHSQTAPPIQAETFLSPFPNCLYYLVSTTLVFPSLLPLAFICIINWIYLCEETLRGLDSAKRVNNFYHQ